MPRVPPKEWLVVVFPPFVGVVLVLAGSSKARAADAWPWFVVVLAVSLIAAVGYCVYLGSQGRLFLRGRLEIEENKAKIGRAKTAGFAMLPVVLVIGVVSGSIEAVLLAAGAGVILGMYPALMMNFIRLRREDYWRKQT